MLAGGEYQRRAAALGEQLAGRLAALPSTAVSGFRVRGLWAGVDVVGRTGREVCQGLMARGVLAKDTHGSTIRLAPPLSISERDLDWALDRLADELGGAPSSEG